MKYADSQPCGVERSRIGNIPAYANLPDWIETLSAQLEWQEETQEIIRRALAGEWAQVGERVYEIEPETWDPTAPTPDRPWWEICDGRTQRLKKLLNLDRRTRPWFIKLYSRKTTRETWRRAWQLARSGWNFSDIGRELGIDKVHTSALLQAAQPDGYVLQANGKRRGKFLAGRKPVWPHELPSPTQPDWKLAMDWNRLRLVPDSPLDREGE